MVTPPCSVELDPANLVLARCPVAGHRVHMVVDQPGRDHAALRVDLAVGAAEVEVRFPADRADEPVLNQDRVGIKDRPGDIARQQKSDIADRRAGRLPARRRWRWGAMLFLSVSASRDQRAWSAWSAPLSADASEQTKQFACSALLSGESNRSPTSTLRDSRSSV